MKRTIGILGLLCGVGTLLVLALIVVSLLNVGRSGPVPPVSLYDGAIYLNCQLAPAPGSICDYGIPGLRRIWLGSSSGRSLPLNFARVDLYVLLALFATPAVVIALVLHWPRRRRPGSCQRCGYDLRATPDRCPECGHAPGQQTAGASALRRPSQ